MDMDSFQGVSANIFSGWPARTISRGWSVTSQTRCDFSEVRESLPKTGSWTRLKGMGVKWIYKLNRQVTESESERQDSILSEFHKVQDSVCICFCISFFSSFAFLQLCISNGPSSSSCLPSPAWRGTWTEHVEISVFIPQNVQYVDVTTGPLQDRNPILQGATGCNGKSENYEWKTF